MSGEHGAGQTRVADEEMVNWVRTHSQSTRDDDLCGSGERRGRNPPNTEADSEMDCDEASTPPLDGRLNGSAKRGRRASNGSSPGCTVQKRLRFGDERVTTASNDFITIEGLKQYFRNAVDREVISLYIFSVAYIPLKQLGNTWQVGCNNCGTSYQVCDENFCPAYVQGQPVFTLHCTKESCDHISSTTEMADAAFALMRNLTASELTFLGISTESVSDSDEGTPTYKITSPLVWMGNSEEEEIETATAEMHEASRTEEEEPEVLTQPEQLADNTPMRHILDGLTKQVERLEAHILRVDDRSATTETRLREQSDEIRRLKAENAEWKDRAKSFQEERDELRRIVEGERMDSSQNNQQPQRNSRARDTTVHQPGATAEQPCLRVAPPEASTREEMAKQGAEKAVKDLEVNRKRWCDVVAAGIPEKITDLPEELQIRLQRVSGRTAAYRRHKVRQEIRKDPNSRRYVAMYFRDVHYGKGPRVLKQYLQDLVGPLDRDAIVFVDFIGGLVAEVLVDETYSQDVATAMWFDGGFSVIKDGNPLRGFATRYKATSEENDILYNATKMLQRIERLLSRPIPPIARNFYNVLQGNGEKAVEEAKRRGASIPADQLTAGRNGQRQGNRMNTNRDRIRPVANQNRRRSRRGEQDLQSPGTHQAPVGSASTPSPPEVQPNGNGQNNPGEGAQAGNLASDATAPNALQDPSVDTTHQQ